MKPLTTIENTHNLKNHIISEFGHHWKCLDIARKEKLFDSAYHHYLKLDVVINLLPYIYPGIDAKWLWLKAYKAWSASYQY